MLCISAAFVSLRSIIIVELLGIDKLTNSFGVVVLCQGLSTFIGAPIAGTRIQRLKLLHFSPCRFSNKDTIIDISNWVVSKQV